MPHRVTIGTSPLSALSEVPAPPSTTAVPHAPPPVPSLAERTMSAWVEWMAANVQAAVGLQNGLLRANQVVLDSAWDSYGILARQWLSLTRELQQAMLTAFEAGRGCSESAEAAGRSGRDRPRA